jgi:hypothetical protein
MTAASDRAVPPAISSALGPRLRLTALAALCVLGAMLAIGLTTHVAQEPLQWIRPTADYARFLAARPLTFRVVVGLDNAFIALYAAQFVLLYEWVAKNGAPRALARFALGAVLLAAGLDLGENMHFLVMSRRVDGGFPLAEAAQHAQALASWAKFHVSYVGLFAFGLVYPRRTKLERGLAFALMWMQLAVGIAVYVFSAETAARLAVARVVFFIVGLSANAYAFKNES